MEELLRSDQVFFLDTSTKDETLAEMIARLDFFEEKGREEFAVALHQREKLVSTGLGMGVAIPHARLPSLNKFFIAIAILKQGVDWQALDGLPVRIVVMVGGPAGRPGDYLQVLSRLTLALKSEECRKKILQLSNQQEIVNLLAEGTRINYGS